MAPVYMQNVTWPQNMFLTLNTAIRNSRLKNSIADSLTRASSFVIIKELIKCVQ